MSNLIVSLLNSTAEDVPLNLITAALEGVRQPTCPPCLDDNGSTISGVAYGLIGAVMNWLLHGAWQLRKWWLTQESNAKPFRFTPTAPIAEHVELECITTCAHRYHAATPSSYEASAPPQQEATTPARRGEPTQLIEV